VGETPGVPPCRGGPGSVCAACHACLARDPYSGGLHRGGTHPSDGWSLTPPAQPGDSHRALHRRGCSSWEVPRSLLMSCLSDPVADAPCAGVNWHELISATSPCPVCAVLSAAICGPGHRCCDPTCSPVSHLAFLSALYDHRLASHHTCGAVGKRTPPSPVSTGADARLPRSEARQATECLDTRGRMVCTDA